jgi:hypothetical protein
VYAGARSSRPSKQDATGRGHVVEQCAECNGDDLLDRIRTEHKPT